MAGTISSVGIGSSGLDVASIITKMVELEKAPLTKLAAQSTLITTRISAYSQIKSLSSTLSDAALNLSLSTTWKAMAITSSDTSSVQVASSGTSSPAAASFSVQVQQLAKAQSVAGSSFGSTDQLGTGTLRIQLGTWTNTVDSNTNQITSSAFAAGSAGEISINIADGESSISAIAAKINAAGAGVTATVLTDANGQRLLLRSNTTGEVAGFRLQVDETVSDGDPETGLSQLAFDPETGATGMASTANFASAQFGQNAKALINNIAVTSTTNTFTDTIPGLRITASKVTTTPVDVSSTPDKAAMTKAIQTFVDAYNALNSFIGQNTAYDTANEQATLLQGDSAAIGIQNMLRNLVGSSTAGGKFERLSDIGVSLQRDGSLSLDSSKLDKALLEPDGVVNLFTANNETNAQASGFGVKLKSFMSGLLSSAGVINNRNAALEIDKDRNADQQTKVNDRADRLETRLQKQYTALDIRMSQLTALDTYIKQQVAQWNKSTG